MVGIAVIERYPLRTIPGQALIGLFTAAMYDLSLSPLSEPIPGYHYTVDTSMSTGLPYPIPCHATIGIKKSPNSRYPLLRSHVMTALWLLGDLLSRETDLQTRFELNVDLWLWDQGELLASGSIVQPPAVIAGS